MADDKAHKEKDDEAAAEPGAEGAAGEENLEKKGPSKKLIIIGAVVMLLLIGGGGGGAYFFLHGKKADAAHAVEQANAESGESKGKVVFFNLGDLLVNLSGEGKHPNFLKVKINLELADEKDIPLIEAVKPRIVDNFQVYLRELRIEDLRGSAGMYRLREELLMRVTEAAQPVRIRDVLFQEMLVQ